MQVIQRKDLLKKGLEIPATDESTGKLVHIVIDEPTQAEWVKPDEDDSGEIRVKFSETNFIVDAIDIEFI